MPIKHEDDLFHVTPFEGELDNIAVTTLLAWILDNTALTTPALAKAITTALDMKGHTPTCKDMVGSYALAEKILLQLVKE